ncbi:alpha/beta-hydrolase [Stipitochalara longipes BDJ]|nr:alpha/beta-hydrolase [Stipitochalara longipes BDJ]
MDILTKKTVQTSRGFTYTYYVSPASSGKPTVFLLHGWPDSAALWEDLATKHLIPAGYGVIIPDCLGYGGSSKPTDVNAYNPVGITNDFHEILSAEDIEKVIAGGHDWGAGLAQRFYIFHPERCVGLFMFNVAIMLQPAGPMVLDVVKPIMKKSLGYFPFEYWYLFTDPVNGPALIDKHVESLFTVVHAEPEGWKETLCAEDGLRKWLEQDKKGPVQAYATDKMRNEFVERLSRDGLAAPLCYYRAHVEGVFYEQEKKLSAERYKVNVPYLFIAGMLDIICLPQAIEQAKSLDLTPYLTVEEVDAGHWCMLAKPKEVGEAFLTWLADNF